MSQASLKNSKINIDKIREEAQKKYRSFQLEIAAISQDLGVDPQALCSWKTIPGALKHFSQKNKNPVDFFHNLDIATYSLREKLRWNAKMAGQIAFQTLSHKLDPGNREHKCD